MARTLEGNHFGIVVARVAFVVVVVIIVGLAGLPACLFQAFNYVCLGPEPDTHTVTPILNQAHTKTWQKFCNARQKGHTRCWSVSVPAC